jgi:hypothetical protein
MEDQARNKVDASSILVEYRPSVRLCIACTRKDENLEDCERQHCRKIFRPKRLDKGESIHKPVMSSSAQTVSGLASFQARLRTFEFKREGHSRSVLPEKLIKTIDPSLFANAGPIHVALTFGPLTIENGLQPWVDISLFLERF